MQDHNIDLVPLLKSIRVIQQNYIGTYSMRRLSTSHIAFSKDINQFEISLSNTFIYPIPSADRDDDLTTFRLSWIGAMCFIQQLSPKLNKYSTQNLGESQDSIGSYQ